MVVAFLLMSRDCEPNLTEPNQKLKVNMLVLLAKLLLSPRTLEVWNPTSVSTEAMLVLLSRSTPHFLLANHLVVCVVAKRQDLWKKHARAHFSCAMTFVSSRPLLLASRLWKAFSSAKMWIFFCSSAKKMEQKESLTTFLCVISIGGRVCSWVRSNGDPPALSYYVSNLSSLFCISLISAGFNHLIGNFLKIFPAILTFSGQ